MTSALWDERIARARTLAAEHPPAAHLLIFYAGLAEYQKSLADRSPARPTLESALTAIPDFLSWLSRHAPAPLADATAELRSVDVATWRTSMTSHVPSSDVDARGRTERFIAEALIQPYAEVLATERLSILPREEGSHSTAAEVIARCDVCGGRPVVGVLRQEGQGARRSLLCGLCFSERGYLRGLCPACGETEFDALPIYTAEQSAHIRIDACDSCRTYLKTIDLTKDGLAIPIVDDIASVSLDLWARERGYVRLRPNVLGI